MNRILNQIQKSGDYCKNIQNIFIREVKQEGGITFLTVIVSVVIFISLIILFSLDKIKPNYNSAVLNPWIWSVIQLTLSAYIAVAIGAFYMIKVLSNYKKQNSILRHANHFQRIKDLLIVIECYTVIPLYLFWAVFVFNVFGGGIIVVIATIIGIFPTLICIKSIAYFSCLYVNVFYPKQEFEVIIAMLKGTEEEEAYEIKRYFSHILVWNEEENAYVLMKDTHNKENIEKEHYKEIIKNSGATNLNSLGLELD